MRPRLIGALLLLSVVQLAGVWAFRAYLADLAKRRDAAAEKLFACQAQVARLSSRADEAQKIFDMLAAEPLGPEGEAALTVVSPSAAEKGLTVFSAPKRTEGLTAFSLKGRADGLLKWLDDWERNCPASLVRQAEFFETPEAPGEGILRVVIEAPEDEG